MTFSTIFLLDCGGHVQKEGVLVCKGINFDLFHDFSIRLWWKCSDGWYLLVRVSILTFSTIFPLYCGGNVQTGWYLFVRVSILTLSSIFLLDCGGNVQTWWYFLFVLYSIKKN